MHFLIGTSGHVDHGKTALIRALTGIETDRLREEKERGLSIVPGFAFLDLPDVGRGARRVGIVDVPGHERFLKNTLTGLSGVDIALLVVASDEGVSLQTREHARALKLLRVPQVLGVLAKCDAVDEEFLELARTDLRAFLDTSGWHNSPICEVSARRSLGLGELKASLARACDELESASAAEAIVEAATRPFRMAIDRAFSVPGRGTIVTGSVAQGRLEIEGALEVLLPGGQVLAARARSLESHGQALQVLERGQRGAINLAGLGVDEIGSGATLSSPGALLASARWEAWIEIAPDGARGLKKNSVGRLHAGTAEVGARVNLPDGALEPGQSGAARITLDKALACAIGDRFVLREVSSERIVGGGMLLHIGRQRLPDWALATTRQALEDGQDEALLLAMLGMAGRVGMSPDEMRRALRILDAERVLQVLGARGSIARGSTRAWRRIDFDHASAALEQALLQAHARQPALEAIALTELGEAEPADLRAALLEGGAREGRWSIENGLIRHASHRVERDEVRPALESAAEAAGWRLLTPEELVQAVDSSQQEQARSLLSAWLRGGEWTRVGPFVAPRARMEAGARLLESAFEEGEAGEASTCSVTQAGAAFGVSRKWAVPMLEWFDKHGWTRRLGDSRVRGPRLRQG